MDNSVDIYLDKIQNGQDLSEGEMRIAMTHIMNGEVNEADIKDFLLALSHKGETPQEITGAARVMREKSLRINASNDAIDCCGTGGDKKGTYNISTAVAIVAASCGVPMAKHGNRASSSKSGAADVLEALGVNLDAPKNHIERAISDLNFGFLMAPKYHSAMKHVAGARKSIADKTIFNLLGPLANPAGTARQLIGVYDKKWLRPMAETLRNLGTKRAFLVCGHDGLDEITVCADTSMVKLHENGEITEATLTPDDFGLPRHNPDDLTGGNADQNAKALLSILNGAHNAYRDIVLVNTAAVLVLYGRTDTLKNGVKIASQAIDNKKSLSLLEQYIIHTNKN